LQDAVGDGLQLGVNLGQRAGWLEDVEVAVERNLVSDLGLVFVDPRIGRMRQNLTLEIGFNILAQRHVLGVAQAGVGLGLAFAFPLGFLDDVPLGVAFGPLDGDRPVAEVGGLENAAERRPLRAGLERLRVNFLFLPHQAFLQGMPSANTRQSNRQHRTRADRQKRRP